MRSITVFLIFMVICTSKNYCQNIIYKGTESYRATNEWQFELTNEGFKTINLSVAKAKTTLGYLMLSFQVNFKESISGTIMLYLSSGETVVLQNRIVSDFVDGESHVLYSLTSKQINLLESSDILKIRFSIKAPTGFGIDGSYTANNPYKSIYKDVGNNISIPVQVLSFPTANEISNLFQEQE